jgi:hypothetical protein
LRRRSPVRGSGRECGDVIVASGPAHAHRGGGWVLLWALLCGPGAFAQALQGGPGGFVFTENEELVYNVRYAFFNLGQIRIITTRSFTLDGHPVSFARALIDSYRGVPFVDLHAIFESTIDHGMFSRRFMGKIKQDETWDFSRYYFDYDRKWVIVEMGGRDTVISSVDTVRLSGTCQDGMSLYFLARDGLFSGKTVTVPTMIKEKLSNTTIAFGRGRSSVEIDAVEYPIDVVEFDGTLDFVGIFGLTGYFEGWFSNDEARIPIKAKMKVILGSVTVELMEYKRAGWVPPRAVE